jgi:hypothetical protein
MWKPEVCGTSGKYSAIAVICVSSISSTSENIQCELINDEQHMIHQDDRLTNMSVELMQISRQFHVGWIPINSLKDHVMNKHFSSHHMTHRVLPAMKYSEPFP